MRPRGYYRRGLRRRGGALAHGVQERRGHPLVELLPGERADLVAREVGRQRATVRAVAGHRVVRVADEDHARAERDAVAGQSVGVAAAVPALVAVADQRADALEERDRLEDLLAHDG